MLGCSEKTVSRGLEELAELSAQPGEDTRIRKPGGGRPRYDENHPDIDRQFLEVLKEHTAGDPMDERVVWTDLTPHDIAGLLDKQHQVRVSKSVVRKLLKKHNNALAGARDMRKQTVLDRIVFGTVGRVVSDADLYAQLIGQFLQVFLEDVMVRMIAAPTITQAQDGGRVGISQTSILTPPGADTIASEFARVLARAEMHVTEVALQIIDPM